MVRNIIGLIVGLTIAVFLLFFMEMVPGYLYPVPEGVDIVSDSEEAKAYFEGLPFMAYFLRLIAILISSYCGSWALNRISDSRYFLFTSIYFVLFLGFNLWIYSTFPHPVLADISVIILVPVVTYIGHVTGRQKEKVDKMFN